MDPQTPQGRYELGFRVSDVSQGQVGVRANVTVEVTSVSPGDVIHAIPVTLAADAYRLVREGKEGKSLLRQLEASARAWAGVGGEGVRVVTVQPLQSPITPTTRVWLASPGITSLHHILLHRKEELSRVLGVGVQGVGVGACGAECAGGGCLSRAELGRGYSLVDAHASAVVGPQVEIAEKCGCGWAASTACSPSRCLNGGRCLPTPTGGTRCVCPEGTSGPRCKVLARHFDGGGGWAWAASVPPCPETHISLEVLTASQEATLLYSGPDQHQHLRRLPPDEGAAGDVVSLELVEGRPSLLLDLGGGPVTLTLPSSPSFADLAWHRIDLIWKDELVEMIVDLCSGSSLDGPRIPPDRSAHNASSPPIVPPDAHTCRGAARLPRSARVLDTPQPLQVGGMAHPPPAHAAHGWPRPLRSKSLRGCIRNVRINGELMDLGSGILSLHSTPGCPAVDCTSSGLHCGLHARCQGSPGHLRCECHLGWTGPGCDIPTVPTTFHLNSFVKLALSFTPLGYTSSISLRFRTWQRHGDLVVLSSQDGRDSFGLQLVGGRACVLLQLHPSPPRSICLTQAKLTDGIWHRLTATRYGSATFLTADDGDDDLYNASVSLEGRQLLSVDREGGIRVGGSPEWVGSSVGSEGDFHDGCLDDVRISGRGVSLPPAGDDDDDDGVSASKGVERGCRPPPACANVTCRAPLTCIDTWRSYHCGCGEGTTLDRARRACQDVDECRWAPCLHGGTCLNTAPGYACACPSGFGGRHCHVQDAEGGAALRLSPAALAAVVAWCALLLLLLVCAFLLHQRRSAVRRGVVGGREPQGKGRGAPPRSTPNLLQLRLLKPPKANGQTPCARNPNIADVDVLQVDAASVTSSLEEQRRPPCTTPPSPDASRGDVGGAAEAEGAEEPAEGKRREKRGGGGGGGRGRGRGGGGGGDAPAGDDLRNYAYEGDGSSPGSLSSCLESCNGSAKFLGGFREVAHILES